MVQLKQVGAAITAGKQYIVRFKAKSSDDETISLWLGFDVDPWTETGEWDNWGADLNTEWQSFERIFTATETTIADTRFSFYLGGVLGTIWIDDVEIYEATTINNSLVGSSVDTSAVITDLAPSTTYSFSNTTFMQVDFSLKGSIS